MPLFPKPNQTPKNDEIADALAQQMLTLIDQTYDQLVNTLTAVNTAFWRPDVPVNTADMLAALERLGQRMGRSHLVATLFEVNSIMMQSVEAMADKTGNKVTLPQPTLSFSFDAAGKLILGAPVAQSDEPEKTQAE
jgi:hypothetical protein